MQVLPVLVVVAQHLHPCLGLVVLGLVVLVVRLHAGQQLLVIAVPL